jgi:hypothetical protein
MSRSTVADERFATAGEYGGEVTAMQRERGTPHRIDTSMHAMEESALDAPPDPVLVEPERAQLARGDHLVLSCGRPRDDVSGGRWPGLVAISAT